MTRWLCDSSSTVWNCATSTVQGRRSRRVKPRQMDGWWRGSISPTPSVPPALRRETPGSRPSGGGTHTHTTLTHRVSLMCSSRIMSHHFRAFTFDMTSQTCWFPLTLSPNRKNWRRLKIDEFSFWQNEFRSILPMTHHQTKMSPKYTSNKYNDSPVCGCFNLLESCLVEHNADTLTGIEKSDQIRVRVTWSVVPVGCT